MATRDLTSMTVSLPAMQKEYVKRQATATGCSTPSEYIRRLIHADAKAHEEATLERLILEGLDSPTEAMTEDDWAKLRASVKARRKKKRPPGSGDAAR